MFVRQQRGGGIILPVSNANMQISSHSQFLTAHTFSINFLKEILFLLHRVRSPACSSQPNEFTVGHFPPEASERQILSRLHRSNLNCPIGSHVGRPLLKLECSCLDCKLHGDVFVQFGILMNQWRYLEACPWRQKLTHVEMRSNKTAMWVCFHPNLAKIPFKFSENLPNKMWIYVMRILGGRDKQQVVD